MKCTNCNNEMVEKVVTFCSCDANPPVIIENTPALACEVCGAKWYTDATVEVFEKIRDNLHDYAYPKIVYMVDFPSAEQGHKIGVATPQITYGALTTNLMGSTGSGNIPTIQAGLAGVR